MVGFIHGVMNTDNCSIAGETIDYGPCAFMEAYDAATVFSSIDHYGRYAYGNQPRIVLWNLHALAETLLPLIDEDQEKALPVAEAVLTQFGPQFEAAYHAGLRAKLGLAEEQPGDADLVQGFLKLMAEYGVDFTRDSAAFVTRLTEIPECVPCSVTGRHSTPGRRNGWRGVIREGPQGGS